MDTLISVPMTIDNPINGGEWRLSRQEIGPRGGKKWVKIYSTPATGGYLPDMQLRPGLYKVTYWSNRWPHSYQFEVLTNGNVIDYRQD